MSSRRAPFAVIAATTCAALACGDARVESKPAALAIAASANPSASAPPAPDFVYPPDGPIPALRTGALPPKEIAAVADARVISRHAGVMETLLVEVPLTDDAIEAMHLDRDRNVVVSVAAPTASDPRPHAFIVAYRGALMGTSSDPSTTTVGARPATSNTVQIWVRRALNAPPSFTGDIYTPYDARARVHPGAHLKFKVDDTKKAPSDPKSESQWMQALATHFSDLYGTERLGPFYAYATSRLRAIAPTPTPRHAAGARTPPGMPPTVTAPAQKGDLARLMETTTGITSIQEALQSDRSLLLGAARAKATIALSSLKGPALTPHPWKTMLAQLKTTPPAEPLAAAAPAEFHYTRAADIGALLGVLDHLDAWGTPLVRIMNDTSLDRAAAARYENELGLRRGPLTRALGPTAIADLAVVGSDPYVLEGTDLTLIFRVKSRGLFDPALAGALSAAAEGHGAVVTDKRTHDGVDVVVSKTPDGAVKQQRASVGDLELVSNSAAAIDVVIDTIHGKHAKLQTEPDFQYMLARDATTRGDVLSYMSDRFVAEVVGPKQKILEARRQIALAELSTPGFAALLYGHMNGKSPQTAQDLVKAKLLDAAELAHANGATIAWKPGDAPRSSWGTPAAMTPLFDLPPIATVTDQERDAYARFVVTYQSNWSHYIDPVAVRVAVDPSRVSVDVRELPLIDHSDYKDVVDFVGDTRFDPGKPSAGMRAVFAVGDSSQVRQSLNQGATLFLRRKDVGFEWIADWAAIGMLDKSLLAIAASKAIDDELPQVPKPRDENRQRRDDLEQLYTLPLYVAIGVRNPIAAALALTAMRNLADEMLPGMVEWSEAGRHRGTAIVRISVDMRGGSNGFWGNLGDGMRLHYALVAGALVIAFDELVVRRIIDERLDGKGPKGLAEQSRGTQLAFDLAGDKGGALFTTMTWLLEASMLADASRIGRATAEALFRGAPERANDADKARSLALAYFGAIPSPADGGAYTMSNEGLRDPARGTLFAPSFPALPVAGSPVAKVLGSLAGIHTEMGFDDESHNQAANPMRSLHARATIDLR